MKNPVTVMMSMVSVELVLYTMCLCAPQWVIQPEGTSAGLFAVCNMVEGLFRCTASPAWMGTYSLTWMFLAGSCVSSFLTLFAIRPTLIKGKRVLLALVLNILSVITFLVSIGEPMLEFLGWSFYICCASLFYAIVVSVTLGLVDRSTRTEPAEAADIASTRPSGTMRQTHAARDISLHS
ncbi:hypothetical protein AAFF_G00053810 [Aldrovandia affinis]|uniref:Transmembrane protein n=1 Tax=Aldrovandia affinis TaxID=143900 RepID=A0AAD7S138_9TELE|nr:hypothetical protein AAFF_G00053810 [Aldrovandia affinis]